MHTREVMYAREEALIIARQLVGRAEELDRRAAALRDQAAALYALTEDQPGEIAPALVFRVMEGLQRYRNLEPVANRVAQIERENAVRALLRHEAGIA